MAGAPVLALALALANDARRAVAVPAAGITGRMVDTLGPPAGAALFMGPDQAAPERMPAGFEPAGGR